LNADAEEPDSAAVEMAFRERRYFWET